MHHLLRNYGKIMLFKLHINEEMSCHSFHLLPIIFLTRYYWDIANLFFLWLLYNCDCSFFNLVWNGQAVDISRTEYELSDIDILYADGITSSDGLASTEFSFPQMSLGGQGADEPDPQDTLLRSVLTLKAIAVCYSDALPISLSFYSFLVSVSYSDI